MTGGAKAMQPEEVTRLVAERLNAGDAAGMAALYEPHAVLACPADQPVTGREASQAICQQMADAGATLAVETPLPTVRFEDWR
jgi:ketosteroid isomerase-like protein